MRLIPSPLWQPRLVGAVAAAVILMVGTGTAVQATTSARSALSQAPACAPGTDVQTTTGPVCGIITNGSGLPPPTSPSSGYGVVSGDREWLGIPYAAPPVGSLRWAPTQPHAPWATTLAATAFGSKCTQANGAGSEDCLYLNVLAPPEGAGHGLLPVMVHIHGGGFRNGSGNGDNTLLANTGNEVIVSMNYRLGIFGFLADSALGPHSGDYGLQDQQAALRWVQDNIAAFGGDPNSVTIYGESAGGSSVCDQIASPTAHGLFHKAISTSGEYNTLLGIMPQVGGTLESQDCKSTLPTQAQANSIGAGFAAAVGCGSASDVAACLRGAPATLIEQAAGLGYQFGGQGTIAPTINGTTLTMTLRQALQTGAVNRVPVIAGTDRDENLLGTATTQSDYEQLVGNQYGNLAPQVLALYPLSRFYSPFVAWRTVAADSATVCSSLRTDQDLARWMPVYGYEIDNGDPPGEVGGVGAATTPTGAAHVAAWDLTPIAAGLDANMQVLQAQEVEGVTTFARTGNPTALNTPTWPEFKNNGTDSNEMSLAPGGDSQAVSVGQIGEDHNCGFWDKVMPKP
jgi:para-nitrobenzyl esterase